MPNKLPAQQPAAEITHGIPHGKKAHHQHSGKDYNNIPYMDTDGIGIHHKITAGITTSQRKQSEFLLDKAKDQPQYHTNHRTYQ